MTHNWAGPQASHQLNTALVDITLCPWFGAARGGSFWVYAAVSNRCRRLADTLNTRFFALPNSWPLRANVTSSMKPEVHNYRNTVSGGLSYGNGWLMQECGEDWTCSSGDMLAYRHVDRQTSGIHSIQIYKHVCRWVATPRSRPPSRSPQNRRYS